MREQRYLTPPEIAERLGVKHDVVLAWVHAAELRAGNVVARRGKRPRWRIAESDLEAFLAARSAPASPRPARRAPRRLKDLNVIKFY
jgi:excisionase family DNA binding protein